MSAIKTVAIAGATGNLGPAVLEAIVDAGFQVTVLARADSKRQFPSGIKVAEVDYNNKDSVTQALKGQDALVSTIGNQSSEQLAILAEAVVAAGIARYIPSEFGGDTTNPQNVKLPVYGPKIAHQNDIKEKIKGTKTTYTFLMTGPFLDWGLNVGFLANLKKRKVELWDGGETHYSATTLPKIGEAVVAILQRPSETANKVIRVHSKVVTQRQILDIAQHALGPDDWQVSEPTTEELEAKSWAALKSDPGNTHAWVFGFLFRAIFAKEHQPEFSQVDNDLLGIKLNTDAELEAIVRHAA